MGATFSSTPGVVGDTLLVCECLQRAAHPAKTGRAKLVGAAADGHLQRRVEADVALLPGDAGRRRRPAPRPHTWSTAVDSLGSAGQLHVVTFAAVTPLEFEVKVSSAVTTPTKVMLKTAGHFLPGSLTGIQADPLQSSRRTWPGRLRCDGPGTAPRRGGWSAPPPPHRRHRCPHPPAPPAAQHRRQMHTRVLPNMRNRSNRWSCEPVSSHRRHVPCYELQPPGAI